MGTATRDTLYAAEHFIARNARLLDRYRYAHHFQGEQPRATLAVLDTYRNIDGGYGNALEPELRGHGSQPLATARALRLLDELGTLPTPILKGVCRHLTSLTRPDGGVPPVLPNIRHTEAAPWWRDRRDFTAALNPTATITGLLHKHHITGPWRDRATAFCWNRIRTLRWTDPEEADAVCVFLHHAPDRARARTETTRLAPVIRAAANTDPAARGHLHTPLDLARRPDDLACSLFTDTEITAHLDALLATQDPDGGWPLARTWDTGPDAERRGDLTVRNLLTLAAHGRLPRTAPPAVPPPRPRMNTP